MNPFDGLYTVTQTWEQHIRNAGASLGGVDYAMPIGTALPQLEGDFEWVTPATQPRPSWYNTGLGNAAAYRRDDGTRTVYGHCSRHVGRQAYSGNTGTSTGPHCHVHDVLSDGHTRAEPFSTITQEGDDTMYAIREPGGGITLIRGPYEAQPLTLAEWQRVDGIVGGYKQLTKAEYDAEIAAVRKLRAQLVADIAKAVPTSPGGGASAAAIVDELLGRLKA